jgi:hypothetical protein
MHTPKLMRTLGWISFTLMWIPFALVFIGMLSMPDGSYTLSEMPVVAVAGLIGTGVFFVLTMVLLIGSSLLSVVQNRGLQASGQAAEATILSIEPTGQTVNRYYVGLSFLLDVRPMSEPSFQARTEQFVPMHELTKYQTGSKVRVKFDPHTKIVALAEPERPAAQG